MSSLELHRLALAALPALADATAGEHLAPTSHHELVALYLFSLLHALGFRPASLDSSSSAAQVRKALAANWNRIRQGQVFATSHIDPAAKDVRLELRLVPIANRIFIHSWIDQADPDIRTLEIKSTDYFPSTLDLPPAAVQAIFRPDDEQLVLLASLLQTHLIDPSATSSIRESTQALLASGPTNSERTAAASIGQDHAAPANPISSQEPLRDPRRFEPGPLYPQSSPFSIGNADLDPLAASPGMFGGRPPVGGFGGGGMVVRPGHPIFQGSAPGGPLGPPSLGGPPRLPPGAVPPGARFDPIGPFGPVPGSGFRPIGPGGPRGSRPFSGDPDNDELPPPGYNDMYL
ncbi:uncharacterized protein BJ171DRAFT_485585 [Polychytrium aggregatum]|uniref:uncharacterized protein n=1 Tax=Polychytrium aggregatum TaxID=110093 RepID=UPI0022FE4356|nr:uncharacterized protein BJ171DRAFT_485585 [Polychytrium aggregatum]KAI9209926.1 hypothetical protein BJ171DRAFT_485585 [Polychytrium aggregatum]